MKCNGGNMPPTDPLCQDVHTSEFHTNPTCPLSLPEGSYLSITGGIIRFYCIFTRKYKLIGVRYSR